MNKQTNIRKCSTTTANKTQSFTVQKLSFENRKETKILLAKI